MKSSESTDTLGTLDSQVEQEVLQEEPRSILMSIIAQLAQGADLAHISLPVFVLEPRSFLERITDSMTHASILSTTAFKTDPLDRFLDVVAYYLSGFHTRPKGVKKPFNPVLGEVFRCLWELKQDDSMAHFVAEQVSHHPPKSTYIYTNPKRHIHLSGTILPKAKFYGNSAASIMEGLHILKFTNINEEYLLKTPNIYARGILFGKMYMEYGDMGSIECIGSEYSCTIEFKTKSVFKSKFNEISGKIRHSSSSNVLYTLKGRWSDEIHIVNESTGESRLLFSVSDSLSFDKIVSPIENQEGWESRRLWSSVAQAILSGNLKEATECKLKIEENQRQSLGLKEPRYFDCIDDLHYMYKFTLIP